MASNKTPPWVWIGCGCLAAILGLVALVGGAGFAGVKFFQGMVDDMADPVARTEVALDTLGAETLPEGWSPHVVFRIPFAMTLIILSDGEPPPKVEGDFEEKVETLERLELNADAMGDNLFIYTKIRGRDASDPESIDRVLSGDRSGGAQVDVGGDFEASDDLGEGHLQVGDQQIAWTAHRGTAAAQGGTVDGVWANFAITCPDGEFHEAIWFQRVHSPGTDADGEAEGTEATAVPVETGAEDDLAGTPADPAAIEKIMSYFAVCG